ncbi:MAG: hypothetical protein NTY08_09080 [Proteobacteria bacterium]|nr:hypothetical protein [Pseudomonadota bacterium]
MVLHRGTVLFVALAIVAGCGKSKTRDGLTLTVPAIEPIVRSAVPTGLLDGTSLTLDTLVVQTPGQIIKSRLFSPGPAELLSLVKKIDDGMAEIKVRTDGKIAPCLADYEGSTLVEKTPVSYSNSFDFDGNGTAEFETKFTQYLSCVDNLTGSNGAWRAFGKKTESGKTDWYIREGGPEDSTFAGASAVKVTEGTNQAELWMRVGKLSTVESQSVSLAHLLRTEAGVIEYTQTGNGVGYDCGLHLLFKDNLVYIYAAVDQDIANQGGTTCATSTNARNKEYCIDASTSSFTLKDLVTCTTAGLSSSAFVLEGLTYQTVDYPNIPRALSETAPSTVEAFTTKEPPKESTGVTGK